MRTIQNWYLTSRQQDPFFEAVGQFPWEEPSGPNLSLAGEIDGKKGWLTSNVVNFKKGIATTYSGSQYKLGKVNPEYVEWCKRNGYHLPSTKKPVANKFYIQETASQMGFNQLQIAKGVSNGTR